MRNATVVVASLVLIGLTVLVVWLQTSTSVERTPDVLPETATTFSVYFSNADFDPQMTHCDTVYPVARQLELGSTEARSALDALVRGVTASEAAAGYFSNVNSETQIENLTIVSGVATVTFNQDFAKGLAGSCKVAAVSAQIEQTLKQFPIVREVVIKVTGVADEEVLQP